MTEDTFAACIGLDWACEKHDFCLCEKNSTDYEYGIVEHNPTAIDEWALNLYDRFDGQLIAICLELKSGPIVSCLQKYHFIRLFFITPLGMSSYRKTFCPSGAKDDPSDAFLQLELLSKHRHKLREVKLDDENTRCIQQLTEQRRRLVQEKVKLTQRISESLKTYYPLVLKIFNRLDTTIFCEFVKRWPNFAEVKKARQSTFKTFFKVHKANQRDLTEQRITWIKTATPLTNDLAINVPSQLYTLSLIKQLEVLLDITKQYDKEIAARFEQHEDKELFESLPSAGAVYAPRLLAAFGSDRDLFINAEEVCKYSGIAPVKVRSGKKTWIHWRYQCSKFIRQTFVEWANKSRGTSYWASAFYNDKRTQGKSHQIALRALAFKWIRIIFRCWKNHMKYDEATYLFALNRRHKEIEKV